MYSRCDFIPYNVVYAINNLLHIHIYKNSARAHVLLECRLIHCIYDNVDSIWKIRKSFMGRLDKIYEISINLMCIIIEDFDQNEMTNNIIYSCEWNICVIRMDNTFWWFAFLLWQKTNMIWSALELKIHW